MADQLAAPTDLSTLLERGDPTATAPDSLAMNKTVLLIECATAVVQAAAGGQRIVQVVGDMCELLGGASEWLALPQWPVTAVASVTLNGAALVAGTDYRRVGSWLWRRGGWQAADPCEPSLVAVVYTHGYPGGAQELELGRSAVLGLIRDVYDNPAGLKAQSLDDWSATYSAMAAHMDGTPTLRAALRRQYGRRPRGRA